MKPNRPVHPPRRPAARSGFTLLELVAVIGIISIMAIVVVGGFNGIVRAISGDTGVSAITRALNLSKPAWTGRRSTSG